MKYNCKENDVIIEKKGDEIWISVDGDTKCGKTVIGLKDLTKALILFSVSGSTLLSDKFKVYKCTDCQEINVKKDNNQLRVGFCDNCEHPLWNTDDD